jgi:hypothetical protein
MKRFLDEEGKCRYVSPKTKDEQTAWSAYAESGRCGKKSLNYSPAVTLNPFIPSNSVRVSPDGSLSTVGVSLQDSLTRLLP